MKIGAQLFTVREFAQTSKDFAETIKKVADIGYTSVQISGVNADISAQEIAEVCKANNLEIVITHSPIGRIKDDTQALIADHKLMGAKYVGLGAVPGDYGRTQEGFDNFIKDMAPAAKAIKDAGLLFMYHNHEFEFMKFGEKTAFEYLADNMPDAGFTLDAYWVQVGGGDPAQWIRKFSGRVDVIHLKDLIIVNSNERRMAEVMEGNINWESVMEAAKDAGVKYAMVEQDACYDRNPFESLKISFQNLQKRGWL